MEGSLGAYLLISGLVLSFLMSALFSIAKIVFLSASRNAAPADDETLRYYSSKIREVLENKPLFSSTVAFGKTFSNLLFTVCAVAYSLQYLPDVSVYKSLGMASAFSLIVLTFLAYQMARAFALRFYRGYLPLSYVSYRVLSLLFLPFSSLLLGVHDWILKLLKYDEKLAFLSEEEKARMRERNDTEALNEEEKEMIRSIFDLGETTVDEIMVPRIDMKALDSNADLATVLRIVREEGHSRIPVFRETVDSIIGILYAKDILSWLAEHPSDKFVLTGIVKPPHFIPVGKKINELMREFKRKHIHFAVVVDEYGGTAGLVTMEDILEEIVGDIQDEYDEEEKEVVRLADNVYLIDPKIDLHDLNEEIGVNLALEGVEYNTLGGLIYHEYGDVPRENTEFEHSGLKITVVKMDHQRIEKVKVQILQHPNGVEIDSF